MTSLKHQTDYRWTKGDLTVTRSICWSPPGCHGGCGVLLYTCEDKLVKIEGDPENQFNRGCLCVRGLNVKEALEHPQRLTKPLLRTGERGQNRWHEISFDAAINIIAEKLTSIKRDYGAESVIFAKGTARDIGAYLPRLCYGFGSPNYFGFGPANGNACFRPRVAVSTALMGGLPIPDLGQFDTGDDRENLPNCILIWGANPIHSNPDGLFGGWIVDAMKKGSKLIVVDPQQTWLASKADYWLRLRPGTDGALALGFLHELFRFNRIDQTFCKRWVSGIREVETAVEVYTPQYVEKLTNVSAEDVSRAAIFLADNKPAALIWGVSVDMHPACVGTIQGLISLMSLTGNVEIPGGMALVKDIMGVSRRGDSLEDFPEVKQKRIGAEEYPLIEVGNPYAQPDVLLDQMESDQPYPIKAAWLQGTSVVPSSFADPERVLKLFKQLDFNVMVDVFLTPAAVSFADVVLPAAMYPEKDSIFQQVSQLGAINQALDPPEECKSDAEIIMTLGQEIAPDYFPWSKVEEWLNYRLRPSGITFAELRSVGSVTAPLEYGKHESGRLRADSQPGFETPTGKIELSSMTFADFGLKPTPHFDDYTAKYRDQFGENLYPYILTTGARKPYFFGAEHRQMPSLRQLQPDPLVDVHPETAARHGISDSDEVRIFSPFGSCIMRAQVSERFTQEVVHCDCGWWFPEEKPAEPEIFGVRRSNVNALLPSGLQGPGGLGYPFRCYICNIEKIEQD